jgi:acyl carrier protein
VLTADGVREILLARWPGRFAPADLAEDAPLGEDGLGLDSIEIVEVAVACEDLGAGEVTEELIRTEPLTIQSLVAHFNGD